MKVSDAIAEILRQEGVEIVIGYPVNHILERGAAAGIRPIVCLVSLILMPNSPIGVTWRMV